MEAAMPQRVHQAGTMPQMRGPRSLHLPAGLARQVLELAVAAAFQVPWCELYAKTRRNASVAFARQVAMYLAHVAFGLSLTESGAMFGRDRTTAAHACSVIEDRRDDPAFDMFLEYLEGAILRLGRSLHAARPCA